MAHRPEGLDPTIQSREIVFEADVASVTPFLKLATVSPHSTAPLRVRRRADLSGLGSTPTPLMSFSTALAFWLMTQVFEYGHMPKETVIAMRMHVRARYRVTGSVLNDSVTASMVGAETTLEIDSPDLPAQIARVVGNAERGCFVMPALFKPVPVTEQTVLNDQPLVME
jgi:hypothetical protein